MKAASQAEGGGQPGRLLAFPHTDHPGGRERLFSGVIRDTLYIFFFLHQAKGESLHPALFASTLTLLRPPEGQALYDTDGRRLPARGAGTATPGSPGRGQDGARLSPEGRDAATGEGVRREKPGPPQPGRLREAKPLPPQPCPLPLTLRRTRRAARPAGSRSSSPARQPLSSAARGCARTTFPVMQCRPARPPWSGRGVIGGAAARGRGRGVVVERRLAGGAWARREGGRPDRCRLRRRSPLLGVELR